MLARNRAPINLSREREWTGGCSQFFARFGSTKSDRKGFVKAAISGVPELWPHSSGVLIAAGEIAAFADEKTRSFARKCAFFAENLGPSRRKEPPSFPFLPPNERFQGLSANLPSGAASAKFAEAEADDGGRVRGRS
jgi:hypothetical protein